MLYHMTASIGIAYGANKDEEMLSHSAAWGKFDKGLHWSDMKYFVETGGALMQHLIFDAMRESLGCANIAIPELRDGSYTRVQRNTRLRARWAAKDKRDAIMDAREWVRSSLPPIWRFTFKSDPARIVNWLAGEWPKCDANERHAKNMRAKISWCLMKEENNET